MPHLSEDPGAWYAARRTVHAVRERVVWDEYLRMSKGCAGNLDLYVQAEPLAWRRLRRGLAEIAHLRRRDGFERDRALAEQTPLGLTG